MRLGVFSDLHLEFQDWTPARVAADVVVLAGDIHVGVDGLAWGRRSFPGSQIVYVPGNHEFYDGEMESVLQRLRDAARAHDVHLLDCDVVVIDGVRFLGATLWTDFALYGGDPQSIAHAMADSKRAMADYRLIRRRRGGLLQPGDTLEIHRTQAEWLARELATPFAGATVVVTHHLPHRRSVHPRYEGDLLNPGFASDLSALVRAPVSLWVHGHTHESMDYVVEGTRVVCNPRGYVPWEPNRRFAPDLVVTVDAADAAGG